MSDMSVIHLISVADPIVKTVMFILLLASVMSWGLIFQRSVGLKKDRQAFIRFEKLFWAGKSLPELYQSVERSSKAIGLSPIGAEHIFVKGYQELVKFDRLKRVKEDTVMMGVDRAMRVALMRESDRLQAGLSWLATIGSVSPYVGLFGTVWGIMNAFQSLAAVSQATLSMVAPGISEALIATAMGLFVAIPAVVAYNRLVSLSENLLNDYENFQEEFAGLLQREIAGKDGRGE